MIGRIGRIRIAAPLCVALVVAVCGASRSFAEQRIANVSQGTNFSLAIFPDRESLVVDLLGRLWRLPASGGGAAQLTPDDEAARHPRVGPDGRLIVYQRLVDGQWDLWLLDVETSERRALLASEYDEREPDFTRDGRSVVFASNRTGTFSLWRIEIDSGVLTQLTAEPGDASFPSVSEHGEIVYVRREPDGWSLRALLPTGAAVELLRSPNRLTAPSWREGDGVVVFNEQRAPADGAPPSSDLKMLVLSARPVVKALTRAEDVFESRVAWLSPGEYFYAADGRIWRRGIAYASRDVVHLFAAVAVESSLPTPIDAPLDAPKPGPGGERAAPEEPYAIQVGRLFDANRSDYLRHVDVHIEGHRIKAIVARGMLPLPERVIDLRDGTIIPGLIDVRAQQASLLGERLGRAWLAHGVTTVREVAADVPEAIERGEAWASGRRLGPRLIVSPAPGWPAMSDGKTAPMPGPKGTVDGDTAPHYPIPVRAYANLRAAPSVFRPAGEPENILPAAAYGLPSTALPFRTSPLGLAYDDVFNTLIESRTVVASTLAAAGGVSAASPALRRILRRPIFERTFSDEERKRWLSMQAPAGPGRTLQEQLVRLIRAGGLVAIGSDSPSVPYGLGVHLEMALLVDAGIPADQVLRMATAGNALALGLDRQLGTLEPGKLADFVVVEGDPLVEITDALDVVAVVKGGVWLDQAALSGG